MCEVTDVVKTASHLRYALENNTVDTLSAHDFRVFIDCTRKKTEIPQELLEEVSKNLLTILTTNKICNDRLIVVATAYCSTTAYLQQNPEEIFQVFLNLLKLDYNEEWKIYLCHAILQLNNIYWKHIPKKKEILLLEEIFKVIETFCSELKSTTFLAFKVFFNLLFKINKEYQGQYEISSELLNTMLDIVMCNWENPLTGIRQQNSLIFGQLLMYHDDIWETVLPMSAGYDVPKGIVGHQNFIELTLTLLSWSVKSKYFLLTALLQKSNVSQVLSLYGDEIIAGLMLSLSVPYLVPAGTDLYNVILASLSLTEWYQFFLPPFTRIVTDALISVEMENLFSYWMQLTFKKYPETLEKLSSISSLSLYAYVSLYKLARKEGYPGTLWDNMKKHKIKSALEDYSDKIRSQAFSLICVSLKSSVLPSDEEFDYVQQFLEQNVNSDNTALRQSILNSVTYFIIRIRDSLLYLIKSNNLSTVSKTNCFSFLDWLHSFLLFNLEESCNYQRKITSLELYKIIFTYFGEPRRKEDNSYARKSNKEHLNLKTQGKHFSWNYVFESEKSQKMLFNCLLDEDNEVRFASATILKSYFHISNPNIEEFETMFQLGLSLCSNQIFYKAESGALVIQVIVTLASKSSSEKFKEIIYNGNPTFLGILLSFAEEQFKHLQEDLLLAASKGSFLYGTLYAVELLLIDPSSPEYMLIDKNKLERLMSLMEKITQFFIAVLSSKSDPKSDHAPSFGEMGMAIASIVESSSVKDSDLSVTVADETLTDVQLTPAQQLVLSCVWLNLKAVNKLCSKLVCKPLSLADTERCISLVVSVLRKCRHKGAIESAGLAFQQIVRYITSSNVPELVELPTQLMDGFLQSLVSSNAATVSRRSAGLAIMVHRLITGDSRPRKPLLHYCVSKLLPIAADMKLTESGMLVDLPQSQSLHFLRTLVQESSLREHMAQYTMSISLVAVNNLASSIWTVRNAALQLFGALVPKLVGQKPHQEEGRGTHHFTFEELYTHAKPLVEMMLDELSTGARSNSMTVHSKLMPLLTLVTNLTVGLQTTFRKDISKLVKHYRDQFQELFKSNIINVRKLSAKAHSLFLTCPEIVPMIDQRVKELSRLLSNKRINLDSENQVHGYLLNLTQLVGRFNEEKVGMKLLWAQEEQVRDSLKVLVQLVLTGQHSYFVKSLIFELNCIQNLNCDLSNYSENIPGTLLGFPYFFNRQLTCLVLSLNEIQDIVRFCLIKSSDYGIQLSCLEAVEELFKIKPNRHNHWMSSDSSSSLLIILKEFALQNSHRAELLALTLEIMLSILDNVINLINLEDSYKISCPIFMSFILKHLFNDQTITPVLSLLLPITCGFISAGETIDLTSINKVSKMIKHRTNPGFDHDVRLHAAKSMTFLVSVFQFEVFKSTENGKLIWNACLDFLQDEETQVRYEASRFVTTLLSKNRCNVLNPFLSLQYLFKSNMITQLMMPEQAVECLWERMLCKPLDKTDNREISNPFDHGVKGIYAESTVISYLAYCSIFEITKSCDLNLRSRIHELCCTLSDKDIYSSKTLKYIQRIKNSSSV